MEEVHIVGGKAADLGTNPGKGPGAKKNVKLVYNF